jgi:hypothetical protein
LKKFTLEQNNSHNVRNNRTDKEQQQQQSSFDVDIHMAFPSDGQLSYNETLDWIERLKGVKAREELITDLYRKYAVLFGNWVSYAKRTPMSEGDIEVPYWRRNYRPLYRCFDLFGIDVMVEQLDDGQLNPVLLEVNLGPDMAYEHPKTNTCMKVIHDAKTAVLHSLMSMLRSKLTAAIEPSHQFNNSFERFVQWRSSSSPATVIVEEIPFESYRFGLSSLHARTLLWEFEIELRALGEQFELVAPSLDRRDSIGNSYDEELQREWMEWRKLEERRSVP